MYFIKYIIYLLYTQYDHHNRVNSCYVEIRAELKTFRDIEFYCNRIIIVQKGICK